MTKVRFRTSSVDTGQRVHAAALATFLCSKAWLLQSHRWAVRGGVYPRSARISLVVGTALNLINQPEWLFGLAPLQPFKFLFTYLVPFLVATYGAVTALETRTDTEIHQAKAE